MLTQENKTGISNIMEVNRMQHESFHDGIQKLDDYVNTGIENNVFDGNKIVEIIDGFGKPLREHLSNEISTLLSLRRHANKLLGLTAALDHEAKKNMVSFLRTFNVPTRGVPDSK